MLAFVAPGPRVTKQIPGRPVNLPCASAMKAAPPSWRQAIKADLVAVLMEAVEDSKKGLAGNTERGVDAMGQQCLNQLVAGQHGGVHLSSHVATLAGRAFAD